MSIHLFVDGNYLYFQAKELGKRQDFTQLEKSVAEKFGEKVGVKFFYTRPPEGTDTRQVIDWLKEHRWNAMEFNYARTEQSQVYVKMTSDMFHSMFSDFKSRVVIVSGSNSIAHIVSNFPTPVDILTTEDSCGSILRSVCDNPNYKGVNRHNLADYL